MIDLTKIVEAIIGLAVALVTTFLIPWLKARLTADQQERLESLLEIAVESAEQIYTGPGRGKEKLLAAQDYLNRKGYDVDVEQIEAAVWSYINHRKVPESLLMIESGANEAVEGAENGEQ